MSLNLFRQYQPQPQYQQQAIQYNRPQTPTKQTLAVPRKQQIPTAYHPSQQAGLNREPEDDESDVS